MRVCSPPIIQVSEVLMKALAQTLLGLSIALALSACASPRKADPTWPEQPSPSYPDPSQKVETEEPPPPTSKKQEAEPAPTPDGAPKLAKQYESAVAKSTINGKATYYADSLAGNKTANGDIYDPKKFTAAHKKLPFGTILRVTRTDNSKITYVRVNDRGPFGSADRIIDLSRAAAEEIDMMRAGVVSVRVEILEKP